MLHLGSPCCSAAAPQFRLTAPSAVLTLGLFQGETGTCSKLSFQMEKPQLVIFRWSGFSFVAKETRALLYGGETRIFILTEEILSPFPSISLSSEFYYQNQYRKLV